MVYQKNATAVLIIKAVEYDNVITALSTVTEVLFEHLDIHWEKAILKLLENQVPRLLFGTFLQLVFSLSQQVVLPGPFSLAFFYERG